MIGRKKCPKCHGRIRTDMFGTVCCFEEVKCGWYDPDTLPAKVYSWCEPVFATPTSRIHIREVSDGRLFLGGGVPNAPLCGRETIVGGWDLPGVVDEQVIRTTLGRETGPTCSSCADVWCSAHGISLHGPGSKRVDTNEATD